MRIKNRSWSPRTIAVGDKSIELPARGNARIDDEQAGSPEVQGLIAAGELIVLPEAGPEPAPASRRREPAASGEERFS